MRCPASMSKVRGFTLLEVLVVMSLLSLVVLALGGALRTIAQTEERVDQRITRTDDLRVAALFLRGVVGRASARKAAASGVAPMFAGDAASMAWVGVMPARYGAGGRYFFRLGIELQGDQSALVLRFQPWRDGGAFPDWAMADWRVLTRGVTSFSIRYEDGRLLPAEGWLSVWPTQGKDYLPERIAIAVGTDSGEWPDLVIPMRVLRASDASLAGATFGGT